MPSSSRRPSRRMVLAGTAAAILPKAAVAAGGTENGEVLDDASHLERTRVARHRVQDTDGGNAVAALRRILSEAEREDRPVVLGGARHSMGGQSLYGDAVALTASGFGCEPDAAGQRCRLSAGARWRDVVAALDRIGRSVAVMQSNSDFSVGGTLSVNGHGWAVPYGAFASTVRAFRMMLADGSVVACSPEENANLFRAAIGGYGLLGIVLDVDLDIVDNTALRPSFAVMDAEAAGPAFATFVGADRNLRMAYGRLSLAPGAFLKEAVLVRFRQVERPAPSLRDDAAYTFLSRSLLRAQTGSDLGKAARWWVETSLAPRLAPALVSRNQLLNKPVSSLGHAGSGRTDILHEYFLPPAKLAGFLAACRATLPGSGMDLLNVTLRYVAADRTSLLSFAPAPRIAAVLLFEQPRTAEADAAMRRVTERLIDEALALGGSFYLPYRLHARRDQVARAYPGLEALLALKRRHDPKGRFRNKLLDAYGA